MWAFSSVSSHLPWKLPSLMTPFDVAPGLHGVCVFFFFFPWFFSRRLRVWITMVFLDYGLTQGPAGPFPEFQKRPLIEVRVLAFLCPPYLSNADFFPPPSVLRLIWHRSYDRYFARAKPFPCPSSITRQQDLSARLVFD